MKTKQLGALFALSAAALGAQAITVTNETNATALATTIGGSGISISNASLTYNTESPSALFSGGSSSVGFNSGIVLTTGKTSCVPGPNNLGNCTGTGNFTTLGFDFTSTTGQLFFNYVFASEEFTQFAPSTFNDKFELILNGVNIAALPGGAGAVEINNVNCLVNSQYYRNNVNPNNGLENNNPASCVSQNLDIQYDGLTVVLQASGALNAGVNRMEFRIRDVGDSSLDSAVFIQAGSFSGTKPTDPNDPNGPGNPNGVPAPTSLLLGGLALSGLAAARRRRA